MGRMSVILRKWNEKHYVLAVSISLLTLDKVTQYNLREYTIPLTGCTE